MPCLDFLSFTIIINIPQDDGANFSKSHPKIAGTADTNSSCIKRGIIPLMIMAHNHTIAYPGLTSVIMVTFIH